MKIPIALDNLHYSYLFILLIFLLTFNILETKWKLLRIILFPTLPCRMFCFVLLCLFSTHLTSLDLFLEKEAL